MAAFDAPKGVGARRVSRSIMSSGPSGTNYQNFDPFEAADSGAANFRLTSQDDEELEVTIPVEDDVGKKDVAVRFTARSLRVTVKGETLIDSPLKGRIYPDECSWSFGTSSGKRALILSLGKRDSEMWSKLLARTPPAPDAKGGPQFVQWPYLDPKFGEGKGAYWESSDADDASWRAYDATTDGPLCVHATRCLAARATYTTWRRVVDALAPDLGVDETELTLIRRWCYAPKRHVMDCTEGLHSTLVKAAGGPFEHGGWESPYPLPYHCDDPCVILEPRLRPAARAAMLDCVLNLLVQPLITVAGSDRSSTDGVTDGGVSEAWMKDMTAKGEALNDSMLSQQLTWWSVWKSTSVSGAPDKSSLSHFSAMTRLSWLGRAVSNWHRHAIDQASRRWRGGRRDDSARTRRKILISTQVVVLRPSNLAPRAVAGPRAERLRGRGQPL